MTTPVKVKRRAAAPKSKVKRRNDVAPKPAIDLANRIGLSYSETGQTLGLSERTIRRLVQRGKLACTYVGDSPRIRVEDIKALFGGE